MALKTTVLRKLKTSIKHHLNRKKSILLLGPRQVGKTTLLSEIKADLRIVLLRPSTRLRYEKDPQQLSNEIEALELETPLIIIDEIQKVPALMDIIQEIIDEGKAQFILTGSSARKLKKNRNLNLLPGRLVNLRLDPFTQEEYESRDLNDILFYGNLPEISLTHSKKDRDIDLASYVGTYLEEEVRAEALVRELGPFARFLELAGMESGKIINYSNIAQELGVDPKTITNYFEILFDCLVAERIDPLTTGSKRKRLVKSNRFLMFDMGIRRLCAQEGTRVTNERKGELLEQYVGLELIRLLRLLHPSAKLRFWKDANGPEVDWVIDYEGIFIPIEVKLSSSPNTKHSKHLSTFMQEYPQATRAFVVCNCERKQKLTKNIHAVPWHSLYEIINYIKRQLK